MRIAACGICHTDLKARAREPDEGDDFAPIVYGHEGAGIVEAVGADVCAAKPGDRVGLSYLSCGTCPSCQAGIPCYCDDLGELNFGGWRPDGTTPLSTLAGAPVRGRFFGQSAFASACLATERNLYPVPDDVPLSLAAPFGCGVLTGAGAVLRALQPPAGAALMVLGSGAVGLSAVLAAVVSGCATIVAFDRVASRLQLAAQLGATHTVPGDGTPVVDAVRELTGGRGVDFILETTGDGAILSQAVHCLAPRGCLAFVASAPETTAIDWGQLMFGRSVRGLIEGEARPRELTPVLFELWRQGRFPVDRLVREYALEDIEAAAADSASGRTVKPVLTFPRPAHSPPTARPRPAHGPGMRTGPPQAQWSSPVRGGRGTGCDPKLAAGQSDDRDLSRPQVVWATAVGTATADSTSVASPAGPASRAARRARRAASSARC